MKNISEEDIYKAWDDLGPDARSVFFTEGNTDILWRTCEKEGVPEETISRIAALTAYVIYHFITRGELPSAIESLGIPKEKALRITDSFINEILLPSENILCASKPLAPLPSTPMDTLAPAQKIAPTSMPPSLRSPIMAAPALPTQDRKTTPLMIHQETGFAPVTVKRASDSEVLDKRLAALFRQDTVPKSTSAPAKIEIKGAPMGVVAQKMTSTQTEIPRVVHYNQFKTTLNNPPLAPANSNNKATPIPMNNIGMKVNTPAAARLPGVKGIPPPPRPPNRTPVGLTRPAPLPPQR